MMPDRITGAGILIVDDQPANVLALEGLLEVSDFRNLFSTTKPSEVVDLCTQRAPDLVILDLHMPGMDGFEILGRLTPWTRGSTRLPVLVMTADISQEARRRALELGAKDFLTKPFDPAETILRITNLLETRLLQLDLRNHTRELEREVRERTVELEGSRLEVLERLAFAAEYRDDETRDHTERIGRASALTARELGLPEATVGLIRRAAPLHDIGKLAVPDSILLKPGRLSPEEFEVMKSHVTIGAEILGGGRSALMQLGAEIALTHHERWDGSGYGSGLHGDYIPISGRIVAVADSFDALTHSRPYKEAWPLADAVAKIRGLSGDHFDPHVVEAFDALDHEALLDSVEEPLRSF